MRFMLMHKMTKAMEQGTPPTAEEMQGIGQLMGEATQAGALKSGEGLKPSAERFRVAYQRGKRSVTRGPFQDPRELAGGYALLRVGSHDEALGWLDRIAGAVGDIEFFLGPVVEMWDMGMGERPADAPLRYLAIYNADLSTGEPIADPAASPALLAVTEAMKAAGALQEGAVLAPPREGARIRYQDGKPMVTDGPFAESKELIAGYAIFEVPSKAQAIDWALRFGSIGGGLEEMDVRLVRD